MTVGQQFYDEQLQYIYANDVDGLIDNHYTPDAVLISLDFVVHGRDALKAHFRDYLKRLGNLRVKSTDKFIETEDTMFFQAVVETSLGQVTVFDAFVMSNGKIMRHFTGVMP
jgi:ketosteroid isomerase-like protein